MCFKSLDILKKSVYNIFLMLMIVYCLLTLGWLIVFVRKCYYQIIAYNNCKNSPAFHPIYSDVKFLQKQLRLYNFKTHLVKSIIISLCLFIESMSIIWFFLSDYVQANTSFPKNDSVIIRFEQMHNCKIHHSILKYYHSTTYMLVYNINFVFFIVLLALISILSRYLASRYLNHPFLRTLIKYIIWIVVECCLIAFCSTIYTMVVSSIIYPLMFLINIILLIRDSLILSRVLKLNLKDLLHHGNPVLYKQQLRAFKFYQLFRIFYIISIFLLLLLFSFLYVYKAIDVFVDEYCFIEFLFNINIPTSIIDTFHVHRNAIKGLECTSQVIGFMFVLIYVLSLNVPLIGVTIWPVVYGLIKRCSAKEEQFRFNYDNMKPLLRHHL